MSSSSTWNQIFKNISTLLKILAVVFLLVVFDGKFCYGTPDITNGYLSIPNRDRGLERFFGIGVAFPYPYFQKPKYRYPVYDRAGRGRLLYGYGGPETYQYKVFTPIDGHH